MARTPTYDPMTSQARSSWLSGLAEACNKITGSLSMEVSSFEDLQLPELFISKDDRYRIYQAPSGNKLWLSDPAPVIKKNGAVISPNTDFFTIDYLGGSIAFEETHTLTESDVITVSASYITDGSQNINRLVDEINSISADIDRYKGAFSSYSDLKAAYPTGKDGDFAIVSGEDSIYIWSSTASDWVSISADVDLSAYYDSDTVNRLLNEKENTIAVHGNTTASDDYYYSGRKTWMSLFSKIRACALTGLVTNDASVITASDTLIVALGKLQAQVSTVKPFISGTSTPTTSTVGDIGMDYVNTSNGEKYHLISVENGQYIWEKYGSGNVTANGGATLSMDSTIGTGPYTVEFTHDDSDAIPAAEISYDNSQSGISSTNVQSAIDTVIPQRRTVTLPVAAWTGEAAPYTQTISVPGVLAEETAQIIQIVPAAASGDAWAAAGAKCTGQGDGTLTFTAREKPGGDLNIFVILQEVVG